MQIKLYCEDCGTLTPVTQEQVVSVAKFLGCEPWNVPAKCDECAGVTRTPSPVGDLAPGDLAPLAPPLETQESAGPDPEASTCVHCGLFATTDVRGNAVCDSCWLKLLAEDNGEEMRTRTVRGVTFECFRPGHWRTECQTLTLINPTQKKLLPGDWMRTHPSIPKRSWTIMRTRALLPRYKQDREGKYLGKPRRPKKREWFVGTHSKLTSAFTLAANELVKEQPQ